MTLNQVNDIINNLDVIDIVKEGMQETVDVLDEYNKIKKNRKVEGLVNL